MVFLDHFLLMLDIHNLPILHCFEDTATFTVHMAVCYLEMSFSFDKTVEITNHVRFSTYA